MGVGVFRNQFGISYALPGDSGRSGAALTSKELNGVMFYLELKLLGSLSLQELLSQTRESQGSYSLTFYPK